MLPLPLLLGYYCFLEATTEVRLEPDALVIVEGNRTHHIGWLDLVRVEHVITQDVSEYGTSVSHCYRFMTRAAVVEVTSSLENSRKLAKALVERGVAYTTCC